MDGRRPAGDAATALAPIDPERDRGPLQWVLSQLLFAAVAGARAGEWIAQAPSIDDARALARVASDRLDHVKVLERAIESLALTPQPPQRAVAVAVSQLRYGAFVDHCFLDLALVGAFTRDLTRAVADALPESQPRTLLRAVATQQDAHAQLGDGIAAHAARSSRARQHLLGLGIAWLAALERLERAAREGAFPAAALPPAFVAAERAAAGRAIERVCALREPIGRFSRTDRATLAAASMARRYLRLPARSPLVRAYLERRNGATR